MISALIFDFDGTILDTEAAEIDSVKAVFELRGAALDHTLWQSVVGTDADKGFWVPWLEEQVGQVEFDVVVNQAESVKHEILADLGPLPGVVALLDEADAARIGVAIASSSPQRWVLRHLRRLSLDGRFLAVRCRDDVAKAKPHPDLYLSACQALGVLPRAEAVAIEDSRNGALAAKAAGLTCVVCPNSTTAGMDVSHADLVVSSLTHLSLDVLIGLIGL